MKAPSLMRFGAFENCVTLNVGAANGGVSTSALWRVSPVLCGRLGGDLRSHALLVDWVVAESLAPPREEYVEFDDADALAVPCFPSHGHAVESPVADSAARAVHAFRSFPVRQGRHSRSDIIRDMRSSDVISVLCTAGEDWWALAVSIVGVIASSTIAVFAVRASHAATRTLTEENARQLRRRTTEALIAWIDEMRSFDDGTSRSTPWWNMTLELRALAKHDDTGVIAALMDAAEAQWEAEHARDSRFRGELKEHVYAWSIDPRSSRDGALRWSRAKESAYSSRR